MNRIDTQLLRGTRLAAQTVSAVVLDFLRRHGMTRIFGNPGSTEIPFLADLPPDVDYVLGLHEGAAVGVASGYALGTGRPALVNLHTAAGLGNAVNAIACARDGRIPLVIVVGQQDRRQLGLGPFLTGRRLDRLAGDQPVWTSQPAHPSEVPGAISRAHHEAAVGRGPALVVVPMGDWEEPIEPGWAGPAAPDRLAGGGPAAPEGVAQLAGLLRGAGAPALVVGAGADTPAGWAGGVRLAERLGCPVWQDAFASRAGFPQDHFQFAGHLPWQRERMRAALSMHDVVVCVGTPAFRLYLYEPGLLVEPGTRVAVVTDDPEEAMRSRCDLAVLAAPAEVCEALADMLPQRPRAATAIARPGPPAPPADGEPLESAHVLEALAERLEPDTVLVEEAPSLRPELFARVPIRSPLGFVSVANGALGFGLPGAVGLRMAIPERPVVAVLGDGSSMYSIQALWTAAARRVGVLFVVMANGRYAVMDELAEAHGGRGPWPPLASLDVAAIAEGMGCAAVRVTDHAQLTACLDEVVPALRERSGPLLLDVRIS
jgi:benzoylformate decarboxylase